uniref:Uncharacterized protein n=1 Tax=Tetraselmis sp. GSL018 TaxID=582737 RepID=A0A061S8B4_9CHLO|mmetsp:Transcript_35227/g.83543  ORF Transcript_35227/g.83543 Transcript_35227/m.83543 type:complete len:201 (+) Transcript_35227:605-1207(+)
MCTTIRNIFNRIECEDWRTRCAEARRNSALRSLNLSNFTRIVVFRDPFERSYSAYTNSGKNRHIRVRNCNGMRHCSFHKWVEEIAAHPQVYFKNEHFKPQVDIAQLHAISYHYHFRLSSELDQNRLWSLLGQNRTYRNVSSKGSSTIQSYLDLNATRLTMSLIASAYAEDLKLWEHNLVKGASRRKGEVGAFELYQQLIT